MPKAITMLTTLKGSLLEHFYPAGWNLAKLDRCCSLGLKRILQPLPSWNKNFRPTPAQSVEQLDARMGDAIADEIETAHRQSRPLALILPVGPMGMYKTVVARLKKSRTPCRHVTTFNMDEWSDAHGNTMPGNQPGGFEHAMTHALFRPLGKLTVPPAQRNFALKKNLPTYATKIAAIKKAGGKLITVYGIGRAFHIAFWEPHLAADYPTLAAWKSQTHRLGVPLHPLTIEQNALHSFNSRFTLIPAFANTIGPGLFLQSDLAIGGADGAYPHRHAQWQGMSLCVTLQHPPSPWIPSSFIPTLPGRLFFLKELAGPLSPDAH